MTKERPEPGVLLSLCLSSEETHVMQEMVIVSEAGKEPERRPVD